MRVITAKVVGGELDLPKGLIEEGATVTVLVPDVEQGFELSDEDCAAIRASMDEITRGECVSGEDLLRDLRRV
jgi:hypothetical protein